MRVFVSAANIHHLCDNLTSFWKEVSGCVCVWGGDECWRVRGGREGGGQARRLANESANAD